MMPPTRLLGIILGPATDIQRAFLPVVGAEAPFSLAQQVPPLALTAVLSYSSRQPQASPPIPLWLERRSPHIPLGDLRSLLS
jgi:hypothetical protein